MNHDHTDAKSFPKNVLINYCEKWKSKNIISFLTKTIQKTKKKTRLNSPKTLDK